MSESAAAEALLKKLKKLESNKVCVVIVGIEQGTVVNGGGEINVGRNTPRVCILIGPGCTTNSSRTMYSCYLQIYPKQMS